jgi:uncharacterized hydrophobic protein (TIGR00271 family)
MCQWRGAGAAVQLYATPIEDRILSSNERRETQPVPPPLPVKEPTLRLLVRRWFRRLVPPLTLERRAEVQVQLRDASTPNFDYYLLVALSSIIATSGLLTNSAAVIIGAMLVAPLMSPILGISLASVAGDGRLARDGAQGLLRGMAFAVGMAILITLSSQILPFNPIADQQTLPPEIVARTHPSPFDLVIALAGGLAAAYALAQPQLSAALPGVAIATALMPPLCTVGIGLALGDWSAAGGSLLLYLTNLAAIAFAGIVTFVGLGFRPQGAAALNRRELPRSLMVSAVLVAILLIPLAIVSARFLRQGRESIQIREHVRQEITARGGQLVSVDAMRSGDVLHLEIAARSAQTMAYADVVDLRDDLALRLQTAGVEFGSFSIALSVVPSSRLDPEVPPTLTSTSTPGPTPTPTLTPTPSPTWIPTSTSTPTVLPTSTPTPAVLAIANTDGQGLVLRSGPFGAVITRLSARTRLTQLYGYQIEGGLVWIEVMDPEGRTGWVPQYYTEVITLTPTTTPRTTATPTPIPGS